MISAGKRWPAYRERADVVIPLGYPAYSATASPSARNLALPPTHWLAQWPMLSYHSTWTIRSGTVTAERRTAFREMSRYYGNAAQLARTRGLRKACYAELAHRTADLSAGIGMVCQELECTDSHADDFRRAVARPDALIEQYHCLRALLRNGGPKLNVGVDEETGRIAATGLIIGASTTAREPARCWTRSRVRLPRSPAPASRTRTVVHGAVAEGHSNIAMAVPPCSDRIERCT
jgi:hypothetical protein